MQNQTLFQAVGLLATMTFFGCLLPRNGIARQPESAPAGQLERARASMEKSLRQQQAAVEAFRKGLQTRSAAQQLQSVQRQQAVVHGIKPVEPLVSSQAAPEAVVTASAQLPSSAADPSASFFSTPWPKSAPFSVPNVQVVDDSCKALSMDEVEKLVVEAGQKYQVQSDLLKSVMRQESAFKPCALSVAGAMGLMQIMPDTAESLHLDDPFDPAKNVDAGAKFLKAMIDRYQGDIQMALGAYNAGPGRVDKAGGVPPIPETIQYIEKVLGGMPLAY